MISQIRLIILVLCLPMLTACSGGSGVETSALQGLTTTLAGTLKGNSDRKAANRKFDPATSVSQKQVAAFTSRTWIAHLEKREAWSSLTQLGNNKGVLTYLTIDSLSISLRQGVLVASRGLGNDVHVANPRPTLAALSSRGARGSYVREMTFLDPTSQKISYRFDCTMTANGPDTFVVAGLQKRGIRYSEDCKHNELQIKNLFWVSVRSGNVIRTRQWVSPEVGYLDTYLVKP